MIGLWYSAYLQEMHIKYEKFMEIEEHTAQTAQVFNTVANGYDREALRFFPFCADKMLDILTPQPGWQLLDIATGTGQAAIAAARLIQPNGRVQGIDISQRMLDQAANNIQQSTLANIDLHEMDAMALEFGNDSFDAAMCAFGVFFMPDMQAALRGWKRSLKPGAKLIFSSFTDQSFLPMIDDFMRRMSEISDFEPDAFVNLETEQACHSLLQSAGYENINIQTHNMGYYLRNADEWWEVVWNTALRGPLMALPADTLATFRAEHLAAVSEMENENGLWLNVDVIFSSAECTQ